MDNMTLWRRLDAANKDARTTVVDLANLTMRALATEAREHWPNAAYIEFSVTDQDHSGSLFTIAARDADHAPISASGVLDLLDDFASNLSDSNKSVWLPFMTEEDIDDRYRSEYLLIIDKVLAEVPEPEPEEPDATAAFLADFGAWLTDRRRVSAKEADTGHAHVDEWYGSDDTAVDLLRRAASLLGAPETE
jgi:hypothetical protein